MARMLNLHRLSAVVICLFTIRPAIADEGMWPFNQFPSATVEARYGVRIDDAWLDRVRTGTVRLSNCTASFVSAEGLILTNHHCVANCLAEHSTRESSLLELGFLARRRSDEIRCGTQIADVLMVMRDVTGTVLEAIAGLGEQAANEERKRQLTQLEQDCETAAQVAYPRELRKCEAVTLYDGGQYFMYEYRRYDDVRLVFAPEAAIAAFGGDPDNFQFPRWCLDMGVLRAYENGAPAVTPNHLTIDFTGPAEGEPVFVSGHPGSTDRLLTVAQLRTLRDVVLPPTLLRAAELRGRYIQFGKLGDQEARIASEPLFSLENGIKVRRKLLDALHNDALMAQKLEQEETLRRWVAANDALAKEIGDPWQRIAEAEETERALSLRHTLLEGGAGFNSDLFRYARTLVRAAAERPKLNTDRLPEFADAALPRIEQRLRAAVPVYRELEQLTLSFSLERMREWLGPDDALVRELLLDDSPDSLAEALIAGSTLSDPDVRMALWAGGQTAIDNSRDPMIALARRVDVSARAIRKRYEDEVEAPVDLAAEAIARARFAAFGTEAYPDATFTLRLNVGAVAGWIEDGVPVAPFTRLERLFERTTGRAPFALPAAWLERRDRLDLDTPFNLATTNDIVGGNSGSPLINAAGDVVGLIFDGNIHSISGAYWFDTQMNRSVAVHTAIIREALTKIYGADELMRELL
jgi:hypothetical protein